MARNGPQEMERDGPLRDRPDLDTNATPPQGTSVSSVGDEPGRGVAASPAVESQVLPSPFPEVSRRTAALNAIAANARADDAARRTRVLAHPDLAAKLLKPPIGYRERPDQWTGYVPPKLLAEDICGPDCGRNCGQGAQHLARVNTSPRRKALVDIAAEAMRRERDGVAVGG
jgi:hypothetical protein